MTFYLTKKTPRKIGYVFILISFSENTHAEISVPDSGTIVKQLSPEQFSQNTQAAQQYFDSDASQQNYSQDQTPIWVGKVEIEGNQKIDTKVLHELVKHLENKNNVLADLQMGVASITQYYKKQGYFLAKAYLPKQKLVRGILVIKVLEGQLDNIILNNQSHIKNSVIGRYTNRIPKQQALEQQRSNQILLHLSDLSGIGPIQANLQAGKQIGQTDLILDIAGQKQFQGRVGFDNAGSTYTGKYRLSGYVEGNSMMGYGEKISAQLLGSNQDLISGNLNAQFPIMGNGLWIGGGYSLTQYELGEQFKLLDAKGNSENYNLNFTYPLIRSQKTNLNLKLQLEKRRLFDEIVVTDTQTSKHTQASRIALNFSRTDEWGIGDAKGGINQLELLTTLGSLNIKSPTALNIDSLSAKTQGSFNKHEIKFARQQRLTQYSWLTGEFYGQLASKNLDSSEKFSFNQMRAYPSAEGLGDQGWGASINFYYQLKPFLNMYLFQDIGQIQQNKNQYLTEKNTRFLGGTGVGFGGGYQNFDYNATLGWRDTSAARSDKDKNPRLLFQVGWRF
ncbi:ShlB/FhaC/HecB family hemolysin secretion/activation protein [Acinetobacter sp. AS167]|uniref:ShlB/FhaC/HecB family hemolysin secretion/activation protein n=1 Tax=Acinetobacter sp. AS167 TaxID=3127884 RepID=UPI00301A12A4